jgi:hypothetical protein
MLAQPVPSDLVRNVVRAALEVTPRTLFDPRAGYRLQGGLVLRAVLTEDDPHAGTSDVRVRDGDPEQDVTGGHLRGPSACDQRRSGRRVRG